MAARSYTELKVALVISAVSLTLGAAGLLHGTSEPASLAAETPAQAALSGGQSAVQAPATSSPARVPQQAAKKSRGS